MSAIEAAQRLHTAYVGDYGVKTAFYRFINECLPHADRSLLLESIRITRTWNGGRREKLNDERKRRFLFQIRNDFTHRGKPTADFASVMGGPVVSIRDGKTHWWGARVGVQKKSDGEIEYALARWPIVLFEVVSPVIGLHFDDVPFQVQVRIEDVSPAVWVEGVQYAELENPSQFVQLARKKAVR